MHPQFRENTAHVELHRPRRENQRHRDLLIGSPPLLSTPAPPARVRSTDRVKPVVRGIGPPRAGCPAMGGGSGDSLFRRHGPSLGSLFGKDLLAEEALRLLDVACACRPFGRWERRRANALAV